MQGVQQIGVGLFVLQDGEGIKNPLPGRTQGRGQRSEGRSDGKENQTVSIAEPDTMV